MRAVADRVGISVMSVYTYLPGKPELLDLMVDALYWTKSEPLRGPTRGRRCAA